MGVQSEEIQLRIVASGNAAKRELAELGQQKDELKRKIDGLNKRSKDYAATKRKLQNELKQTNERMRKLRGEIDLSSMSMRDLRNRANDLKRVMDNMNPDSAEWKRLNTDLKKVNGRMRELRGSTQGLRGSWDTLKTGLVAGGIGAAVGLVAVGFNKLKDAVIDTTVKFQKMEAVLTLALGTKSAAQKAMEDLKQFAASTPFQIDALTESFVKLVNRGFTPTMAEMRKMGDLASTTGKEMDQLVEAILDAQTGEFERLKEFGIRASKNGDQVTFAFKGMQKQVEFTDEAIRNALLSFGEMEGVAGSMDAISKTLGGRWSNLQDNLTQMAYELGVLFTNMFDVNGATDALGSGVSNLTQGIKTLAENILIARQWLRDWYDESTVLRTAVNLFTAAFKTNIATIMQFLDMAIVQPIKTIIAGVKSARLLMDGEFKQAGAVMKERFTDWGNDWKQFGTDIKDIWTSAADEIRDPAPWQDLGNNAEAQVKRAKEAIEQAKADIDAFINSDAIDADEPIDVGNTNDPVVDEWLNGRDEMFEALAEMRRTQREQELHEEAAYWDEMIALNEHYATGATDLENRKRTALKAINDHWDSEELQATIAAEAKKREVKRQTYRDVANMASQFLSFVGDYMEKGSAAQQVTAGIQLGLDTAMSISSAIRGATEAAAAGGPTAPFLILGYITSMIGTVTSAFTQVSSMVNNSKNAEVDTDVSIPAFATGTKGDKVTPPGWKLVGEEGPELLYTPGGEKVITADDTASIFAKYNMGAVGGLPVPNYNVDTTAISESVKSLPGYFNGTMGAVSAFESDFKNSISSSNESLLSKMDEMINAVLQEKTRPAVVSQRQIKDREDDLSYIKEFSDIRSV